MMEEWYDVPDLVDAVQELFDVGLYDEGLALLDRYKDIYTGEWEIPFLYSRAYSERNMPQEAIVWLRTAMRIHRDNPDCLLGMFYAYTQMRQIRKGARYLLAAVRRYPDNEFILNALIWYYLEVNECAKAVECYERAESLLNYNPEALRNTGIACERLGNFNRALMCFKMSLELDPESDETRDLLADHYILRDEVDQSIELYKSYLKRSPRNIRALSRLVFCLSQNRQAPEAETAARHIIDVYPNSPVGYVDLAYVHLNNDDPDTAIKTANSALDVSPIDAEAWRVIGIAYADKKEFAHADKAFEKALSLSPENPEIIRDYYQYLKDAGKYEEMEEQILKVIELEYPYCMEDYWFFADYYREMGDRLKAFHYLTRAYRCMPGEKDILPPMAEILMDRGHLAFAIPIIKKYIETRGWDDIMTDLAQHRRLRGKRPQEGLRFLRFCGQKPVAFRRFIFRFYVKKFFLVSLILLSTVLFPFSYVWFQTRGLIMVIGMYSAAFVSYKAAGYLRHRRRISGLREK